jgi:[protein-PII] uridylyltransferase
VADSRETALVDQTLMQAMFTEEFDFSSLLKKTEAKRKPQLSYDLDFPTRISVDNDSHPVYTLVDIQTPDRLGLLYLILKGFSEAGLNIALSRIATEKGAAMDTFYVTDEEGNKLKDRSKILSIQQLLQKEVAWKHLE